MGCMRTPVEILVNLSLFIPKMVLASLHVPFPPHLQLGPRHEIKISKK